mmetsp:Transcript_28792/g.76848  ORF Transcript_28792/g.76848 Transcript_28792/m.76848 type:complete len:207 (-) Transcript_28792:604-1224(-)
MALDQALVRGVPHLLGPVEAGEDSEVHHLSGIEHLVLVLVQRREHLLAELLPGARVQGGRPPRLGLHRLRHDLRGHLPCEPLRRHDDAPLLRGRDDDALLRERPHGHDLRGRFGQGLLHALEHGLQLLVGAIAAALVRLVVDDLRERLEVHAGEQVHRLLLAELGVLLVPLRLVALEAGQSRKSPQLVAGEATAAVLVARVEDGLD